MDVVRETDYLQTKVAAIYGAYWSIRNWAQAAQLGHNRKIFGALFKSTIGNLKSIIYRHRPNSKLLN